MLEILIEKEIMAEKVITNHKVHLKQLIAKANSDRPADIKELVDYLILAHASGYVYLT